MGDRTPTFRHLRLVRAPILAEYLANIVLWRMFGDEAFAEMVATHPHSLAELNASEHMGVSGSWVLYHSWLPGRVELSEDEAAVVRELVATNAADTVPAAHRGLVDDLMRRGWCDDVEVDIDALVEQSKTFVAIQNPYELTRFLELVARRRPKTVLEIGTARGGTWYCLSQVADQHATLNSVDLPGAGSGAQTELERELFATFGPPTQRFHFVSGNSRDAATRQAVDEILNGRELDLLFIDGDHSYDGVKSDFELYSRLVHKGGIVALHDICAMPDQWGPTAEVGLFWAELSHGRNTREIVDPQGTTRYVRHGLREQLREADPPPETSPRPAWGIGIVQL
jgi:predicted O-methyltransferase YrrM